MQLTEYNGHIAKPCGEPSRLDQFEPRASVACTRLLLSLVACLFIVAGPGILSAVVQASFVSIQILLEICRASLIALQIFGL